MNMPSVEEFNAVAAGVEEIVRAAPTNDDGKRMLTRKQFDRVSAITRGLFRSLFDGLREGAPVELNGTTTMVEERELYDFARGTTIHIGTDLLVKDEDSWVVVFDECTLSSFTVFLRLCAADRTPVVTTPR